MTKKQIIEYINQYHPDDTLAVNNPASAERTLENVHIKQIYPNYVLVTNSKYDWCVDWVEVMKTNHKEQ